MPLVLWIALGIPSSDGLIMILDMFGRIGQRWERFLAAILFKYPIVTVHHGEILELTVLSYQMSEAKSRKMSKEIEEVRGN